MYAIRSYYVWLVSSAQVDSWRGTLEPVSANWVRRMVEPFADPRIGGCQSMINCRSISRRVERYLRASGALSNDRIVADSVGGERNLKRLLAYSSIAQIGYILLGASLVSLAGLTVV